MSGSPDLIALVQAKRERWVPLDETHEVLVRMPSVFDALRWKIGSRGTEGVEAWENTAKGAVRDWRGFQKLDVHGDSADPLPFDPAIWAALVDYQADWARAVYRAAVDMLVSHNQAAEDAAGN